MKSFLPFKPIKLPRAWLEAIKSISVWGKITWVFSLWILKYKTAIFERILNSFLPGTKFNYIWTHIRKETSKRILSISHLVFLEIMNNTIRVENIYATPLLMAFYLADSESLPWKIYIRWTYLYTGSFRNLQRTDPNKAINQRSLPDLTVTCSHL